MLKFDYTGLIQMLELLDVEVSIGKGAMVQGLRISHEIPPTLANVTHLVTLLKIAG